MWTRLDASATRFDWSARPRTADREVLVSFWLPTIDEASARFLPDLVQTAAANLTEDNRTGEPVEQPPNVTRTLHVDRIITVAFVPSQIYGHGRTNGVLHGIVHRGSLTIIAVLSNGRVGLVPAPREIGLVARW